MFPKSTEDKYC